MPATTQLKSGNFAGLGLGVVLPFTDGMLGAYLTGYNAQVSRRNLVPGGQDAVVVGAPEFHEGYARFTGNASFLELDIAEVSAMTLMLAWRSVDLNAPAFRFPLSNIGTSEANPGNDHGLGIRGRVAGPLLGLSAGGINPAPYLSTLETNSAFESWHFAVGTIDGDGIGREIINVTTGERQVAPAAISGARLINAEKRFRLGSSHFVADTGQTDIAFGALAGRLLSPDEWMQFYRMIKARLSRLSSPIAI